MFRDEVKKKKKKNNVLTRLLKALNASGLKLKVE